MKKQYKAVIIGCGNIAGGYDDLDSKNILTHAHALKVHKRTDLVGVYDILSPKASAFAKKWSTTPYSNLDNMLTSIVPDIIYICTPADTHDHILLEVLKYQPRAVVCEKPLCSDFEIGKKIIKNYWQYNIPLFVNYIRRYSGDMQQIKTNIDNNIYGEFINGLAIYSRGIINNGSHIIDLLRYFFGEVRSFKVLGKVIDYQRTDPTLDVFLRFQDNIKIHLLGGNEKYYSIGEFDLLFSKFRVNLYQFGLQYTIQRVRSDPLFPGYKDLGHKITKKTDLNKALLKLVDNVIGHLEDKRKILCCGADALKTQIFCKKLINYA